MKTKHIESEKMGSENTIPSAMPSATTSGSEPSAAFTPGPWRVHGEGKNLSVWGAGDYWICGLLVNHDEQTAVGSANACLIAAVPDLLEALKAFVAHYPPGVNPFLDEAYRDARAAIDKATGGAS